MEAAPGRGAAQLTRRRGSPARPALRLGALFSRNTFQESSTPRPGGFEYAPHDLGGQSLSFALQRTLGSLAILLDVSLRRLHLGLGFGASFVERGRAGIGSGLAASFLGAEHGCPGFAQTLLIFRSASLGGGDVGPRLLDRTLGFAAAVF